MKTAKNFLALLLTGSLLLGLCACGSGSSSEGADTDADNQQSSAADNSGAEDTASSAQTGDESAGEDAALVYAQDGYIVIAYHGAGGEVRANLCDESGNHLGSLDDYRTLEDGQTLLIFREIEGITDYSKISVSVTDLDAEKNEDGSYKSGTYSDLRQLSTDEIEATGLKYLDGHLCGFWENDLFFVSSSGLYFVFESRIIWLDECYYTEDMTGFEERFSYYAEDGTPLTEYFGDYSEVESTYYADPSNLLQVKFIHPMAEGESVYDYTKEDYLTNEELLASNPYIIYTALDGTEQRIDVIMEEE